MFFSFDFKVSCRVTDCDSKKLIENDKKENQHSRKPEHVSKKFLFFLFSGIDGENPSVVMFNAFLSFLFQNCPATPIGSLNACALAPRVDGAP